MTDSANDSRLYFYLGYGVLAVILLVSVLFFMAKSSDGSSFYESLIASDLALTSDILMGMKGDFNLSYLINEEGSKFKYESSFESPCAFKIVKSGTSSISSPKKKCVSNSMLAINELEQGEYNKLHLIKSSDNFRVEGE